MLEDNLIDPHKFKTNFKLGLIRATRKLYFLSD